MAIYYEPEEIPADPPSPGFGTRVTRQGNGRAEGDRDWSPDSHRHDSKQIEFSKQRGPRVQVSSRTQLIESIKRGESPTWVPNPALVALLARYNSLEQTDQRQTGTEDVKSSSNLGSEDEHTSLRDGKISPSHELESAEIERSRSALHTGDFFERQPSAPTSQPSSSDTARSASPPRYLPPSSPTTPWYAPAVPSLPRHSTEPGHTWSRHINTRSRAPSLGSSLTSSFVFRPPTSPLVHAASNTDVDFPPSANVTRQTSSPERGNRRRTLPPDSFNSLHAASYVGKAATNFSRPFLPPRAESSLPYQAHQPRRSLTFMSPNHSASSPQTPMLPRSRRPSFSSEHSPIQHASMVGSFEESILRGRMSTAPSKPLDFVAQIGVLGRGDCKPNLRCPAHVTVPFPAVFYNYPSIGTRSFSDESPSPYVGTIDLEYSLKPIETMRIRRRPASPVPGVEARVDNAMSPEDTRIGLAIERQRRERQRRRSASPKGPFGGCYRVPQQGQLQIVIKNPNKTAVKLYLVPYSLDAMEPGTKTFVRQRSFSAGPILEKPLTDNPQAVLPDPLQHKSVLRYLIHLKFCCPSKGRYYLYDNIRVVFANRVPDGKENLRNEVQLPEPRYSSYKPCRERPMGSAGAKLAAEKASRRRSSGFGLTPARFDIMDGLSFTGAAATIPMNEPGPAPSTAIPFHLPPRPKTPAQTAPIGVKQEGGHNSATATGIDTESYTPGITNIVVTAGPARPESRERAVSPTSGFVPSTSTRASPVPWAAFGFIGNDFGSRPLSRTLSPSPVDCGEGLLSRELKIMDAHKSTDSDT
jgi:Domain of unknown function (DUF4210)/Chromosome segregation during meiosis